VDAVIIETSGFGIFSNKEKLNLLKAIAVKRGIIVLTDSDGAGFVIRNYLKGALPKELVKQAYIPDICGKERRKRAPGKEGKLGVEGMKPEVLVEALRRAGATFLDEAEVAEEPKTPITKADFCALGLSGKPDSAQKRAELAKKLHLPPRMSANALLELLNQLGGMELLETVISD